MVLFHSFILRLSAVTFLRELHHSSAVLCCEKQKSLHLPEGKTKADSGSIMPHPPFLRKSWLKRPEGRFDESGKGLSSDLPACPAVFPCRAFCARLSDRDIAGQVSAFAPEGWRGRDYSGATVPDSHRLPCVLFPKTLLKEPGRSLYPGQPEGQQEKEEKLYDFSMPRRKQALLS